MVVVGRADRRRARTVTAPGMEKDYLILKRASASRPFGEWNEDDFDVLAAGVVVGRITKVHAAPVGSPWMWNWPSGNVKIGRQDMATRRRARPRWRRSRRAGGGSSAVEATPEVEATSILPP